LRIVPLYRLLVVLILLAGPRCLAAHAETAGATFVGSAACASCHRAEHGDWLASQHRAAMQEPTEATVLGRFDGASFRKGAEESVFLKKDGRFVIHTPGPDGKIADFPVKYVFGVFPLQQYLVELPGGRLQAFGIAWDSRSAVDGGQRWFDLYPGQNLAPGDPLHWTGVDQNWNYQCAWCHSTNLRKNFDSATGAFATTFSEISVGCEACHGPASGHLDWAAKPSSDPSHGFAIRLDQRAGASWKINEGATAARAGASAGDKEAQVCASCHARRSQFSDDPLAVSKFYDAFRPVTLDDTLYHLDGQQRDEVYNFGSFLQSRMHEAGVTCSDCHDPHSGKLRLAGNAVCAQCHSSAVFDQTAHHHHPPGSPGAQCVACHMPTTTYMGVDARHDHSMRIPRPDRTAALATPNACNQCHADKSAAWAVEALHKWGDGAKPGAQTFAEAFHLADSQAPGAGLALAAIVADNEVSAIARASALRRLAQATTPEAINLAAKALSDKSPMTRAAAVAVIANADTATKARLLAPLLSDETRLVRMDAARALAGEGESALAPGDLVAFEKALADYRAAQGFSAERPESQANLGALALARGKIDEARTFYQKALALDPTFAPAAVSLADIARATGDEKAAEETLRKALLRNPDSAPLHHALGLSLIRQKRLSEALAALQKAAEVAPEDTRFAYVYGIALHDTGAPHQAREALARALSRRPFDRDILMAVASYEVEDGDFAAALPHAERLAELEPADRSVRDFLAAVRAGAKTQRQ
jgi:predicted CXXCH cytochrome family protein